MPGDVLILTHGAGGHRDSPLLMAVADAFEAAGWEALRVNLSFRERRPKGPPHRGDAGRDREGLRLAVEQARGRAKGMVVLGGQSYGGRQASILAAEAAGLVDGLLLLSYPLHAPGKPGNPRTDHFPRVATPALFVHGTRDPFGSPDELSEARRLLPDRNEMILIEGAGHDLRKGRGWRQSGLPLFFRPDEPAGR